MLPKVEALGGRVTVGSRGWRREKLSSPCSAAVGRLRSSRVSPGREKNMGGPEFVKEGLRFTESSSGKALGCHHSLERKSAGLS